LAERAATGIFMYSFSGGPERGCNLGEVKRSAATLDTPSAVVAEAVESLMNQAFYMQSQGGRYFFTNQANLNRLVVTRMESVQPKDLEGLELSLLKEAVRGTRLKTFLWPEQSSEIPDTQDLKLAILKQAEEDEMSAFGPRERSSNASRQR